jgi:hypothetical protein
MTVIGALSSFRELGEMSPHKRACVHEWRSSGLVAQPEAILSISDGFVSLSPVPEGQPCYCRARYKNRLRNLPAK